MIHDRCIVCNCESMGFKFCSTLCEEDYENLMTEMDDNLNSEYLDPYYDPYGPWSIDDLE